MPPWAEASLFINPIHQSIFREIIEKSQSSFEINWWLVICQCSHFMWITHFQSICVWNWTRKKKDFSDRKSYTPIYSLKTTNNVSIQMNFKLNQTIGILEMIPADYVSEYVYIFGMFLESCNPCDSIGWCVVV